MSRKSKRDIERDEQRKIEISCARENCKTKEDIISHAKKYASWEVSNEDKMLLAESMIPKGAKRLYKNDYAEYRGVFIAGWLGDSQCIEYGFCDGSRSHNDVLCIPHYSFYVCWKPTLEEMLILFRGTSLIEELNE